MRYCDWTEDFTYPETKMHFHIHKTNFPDFHYHNYWEFFIIISGETLHCFKDKQENIQKNTAYLIHPSDQHRFLNCSEDFSHLNIAITDDYFQEIISTIDNDMYDKLTQIQNPIPFNIDDFTIMEIMKTIHAIQTMTNDKDLRTFTNLLKIVWLDIAKIIYRKNLQLKHIYPDWLNDLIFKMHQPENISKPISEISKLSYYSYSHLNRLFKQYTGSTLVQYMSKLKLNYAAMLLRTTDMNVLDISSILQYDSLSHFIRLFKQTYSVSPKKYRDSYSNI